MKYLFFIIICFWALSTNAQSVEDSVRTTVNNLFRAMKNSDSVSLQSCFADNAVLQTIAKTKDGLVKIRNEKVGEFASSISKTEKGDLDERISFETIRIDGDLASVWTPYSFYYKGNFSHCGVNSFQLVRINNEWKIQYLIDTRRKTGCIKD